ncbi:MAG: hypothetical protein IKN34_05185 [Treponema sp.]|nr:hypothetical protein [Treponema sp.]
MGVAHAHHCLVEVDAGLVDTTELEAMHHVIVGLLCIEVLDARNRLAIASGGEWSDTIGQTFGNHVVAQVDIVVVAYADSYIDRTLPVALSQHLQNHEVALIQCTLACQRDNHLVGDRVGSHQHTTAAYGFLIDSHI